MRSPQRSPPPHRPQHSDITITVSGDAGTEDERTFYLHKFPVRQLGGGGIARGDARVPLRVRADL